MDIKKLDKLRYAISLTNRSELELMSKNKNRELSNTRQLLMYFCCTELDLKLKDVARFFDRHYSTVIHGRDEVAGILSVGSSKTSEVIQYNYILREYIKKYHPIDESKYIPADVLKKLLNDNLQELQGKDETTSTTPVKEMIKAARIDQIEKILLTIKKLENE